MVSSTRLGSIRIIRTSSGVDRVRIEVIRLLRQTDLPEPVAPAIRMCGILARFATSTRPSTSLPRPTTIGWWSPIATCDLSTSPRLTISLSAFGISTPIADLPGIGETIRTSALLTAYAMFFCSAVTRSTLTAGPSSISYLVTVGPRLNPVTCASTWNCSRTSDSASTTTSLARVRCFGAEPGRSSAIGGSV